MINSNVPWIDVYFDPGGPHSNPWGWWPTITSFARPWNKLFHWIKTACLLLYFCVPNISCISSFLYSHTHIMTIQWFSAIQCCSALIFTWKTVLSTIKARFASLDSYFNFKIKLSSCNFFSGIWSTYLNSWNSLKCG